MKKRLTLIFILMSVCVAGITALQLYYSFTNYRFAERVFTKEANDAFLEARDSSIAAHNLSVEAKFVKWMNDTSFVKISCRYSEEQKSTVFTIKEVKPYRGNGQIEISLSVEEIDDKADTLTPGIRKRFIDHMVSTVDGGLKKGTVWFFTQGLGDSLSKAYYRTPIDEGLIREQYKKALLRRGIDLNFSFERDMNSTNFCTDEVSIAVDKPRWMRACFIGIDGFLLGQLKWVIIGSLVLIIITLACFWYTARTLLSQHKLNRIKDDFISNMTHEIHTPITSLLVTAEALKRFSHDEQSRDSYIDIILHQGNRLSALADSILDGARVEANGMQLDDTIDIGTLIKEAAKDYRDVSISFPSDEAVVKGNAFHLDNALRNLLDNAFKYSATAAANVELQCSVSQKKVTISVADNGPGIPDDQKTKIFEQFYRIPSRNVHNVKGYGLGLSYVKTVIEAHRGHISVTDNSPTGAIFTIELPR